MPDSLELLRENRPNYHPITALLELSCHPDTTVREKKTCHCEIPITETESFAFKWSNDCELCASYCY